MEAEGKVEFKYLTEPLAKQNTFEMRLLRHFASQMTRLKPFFRFKPGSVLAFLDFCKWLNRMMSSVRRESMFTQRISREGVFAIPPL